ncbi:hypothetical protein NKDENANG_03845 [Candidatus Entotheonellaceae bacterium PAL068K]
MSKPVLHGVEILDPTVRTVDRIKPTPRLSSLDGKTIGLLDNSKEKADVFLTTLAERLGERFNVTTVMRRRKPTYSRVAPSPILAELGETCDCVITAMGA